jgi:feruloyl esterase
MIRPFEVRLRIRAVSPVIIAACSVLGVSATVVSANSSADVTAATFESHCSAGSFSARGLTIQSAAVVSGVPGGERCHVVGEVITEGEGAKAGAAGFELDLPVNWNGKLIFRGGGGFDGSIPPANPHHLELGYASLGTDSGHMGDPSYPAAGFDASWAVTPGGRDTAKVADYLYRARHQVNGKIRPLIARYYGAKINYAYFVGCSNGGREALLEAQNHPEDYDGFVAGAPLSDPMEGVVLVHNVQTFLKAPIPLAKWPMIEAAVTAQCDAVDGVKDGLVQNPAACSFDPGVLVRDGSLSDEQGEAIKTYLSAARDRHGKFVAFGSPVTGISEATTPSLGSRIGVGIYLSDTAPDPSKSQPWGTLLKSPIAWLLGYGFVADLVFGEPNLSALGSRVIDQTGTIAPEAIEKSRVVFGRAVLNAALMGGFFQKNRKLILYQGFSDHVVNPYATYRAYAGLVRAGGGLKRTMLNARLFMVPDMQHCGHGAGPNAFDPLDALQKWVEEGISPDEIIATKFPEDDPRQPATRTMPVCAFPAMAHYQGHGDVNTASNWSCPVGDRQLEQIGVNGKLAGAVDPLADAMDL